MAVETLSAQPRVIEAGETIRFAASGKYAPADGAMAFVLNDGVNAPLSVAAANVSGQFVVTLTAVQTAALTPGRFTTAEIYTLTGGEKDTGPTGTIDVLPNLAVQATPTPAQAMVTTLRTALTSLAGSDKQSVNFNGQSFTRANVADYQRQLTYWESRVIAEQARVNLLRGHRVSGEIGVTFAGTAQPCDE